MNKSFLNELLGTIAQRNGRRRRWPSIRADDDDGRLDGKCRQLLASDGEASSIALARRALDCYEQLNADERLLFFQCLASDYAPDPNALHAAYARYQECPDGDTLQALFRCCEPPRQELLRRLNLAPGGTYDLVRMRADLLGYLPEHASLGAVDADFIHLFGSWFNRGFLLLRQIDWDTPAAILEKLIDYEAVHEVRDWSDLRRRLAPDDRRCFAFFHPAIGDEPLIFVNVALTDGMPDSIQPILAEASEQSLLSQAADTAAFFGISNCQAGLRGISFGNFLIKQVVQELKRELPGLKHFVTLSPIPGFAQWLENERNDPESPLDNATRGVLATLGRPSWHDRESTPGFREAVLRQAARYLTEARNPRGKPANSVARFHLGNGARLHRINWLGDASAKGLAHGAGLMVNYLYVLDEIETNHERYYAADGRVVASSAIRKLARQAQKGISVGENV